MGAQGRGRRHPQLSQSVATRTAPGGAVQVLRPAVSAETVREINAIAEAIAKSGGTPLAVAKDGRCSA